MAIKITDIFTQTNVNKFFEIEKEFFKHFDDDYIQFIKDSISNARFCCDLGYAKATFTCPICNEQDYRPVSCKSKFCSSCGKIYAEKWALKLSQDMTTHKHRHMLFTIPDFLWKYFLVKREALATLANHINLIFKSWFNKHGIKHFGCIVAIHTFGRDSSFHTHFHVILSLGGFKSNLTWKKLEYFKPEVINPSWRYLVLKTIRGLYPDSNKAKKAISEAYTKNFYVTLKGEPLKTDLKSIQYIGRSLMRPAIAEYRITEYDGKKVSFWYTDTETQKKHYLTLTVWEFMKRLILHIQPKNFKAIRRYGFYARNFDQLVKMKVKSFRSRTLFKKVLPSWAERLRVQFGKFKLICPNCNIKMELSEFRHRKYGVYFYK